VRLAQIRVLADDYGACFRFYRDVLGLPQGFGDETTGFAEFDAGDATIAVFDRHEQQEAVDLAAVGDAALIALAVDDVDAEAARLGGYLVAGPLDRVDWALRVVYLRDPAGTLIELHQPLAAA
jgi:catechol 2,3-dioxygenase-like lactoylglutathione lyase family enzyme